MPIKMRRDFPAAGGVRGAARGSWRLACGGPQGARIIIGGADPRADAALGSDRLDLTVEWQTHGVQLTIRSVQEVAQAQAATVIVHEPVPRLYALLPLAEFDRRARRFWRRVFILVRIPGGRSLLGRLAHASRKRS